MELLECHVQPYPWGSRTALAHLQGRRVPSPGPEAEMWIGAHYTAPSRLAGSGFSLLERLSADPVTELGRQIVQEFGVTLPFLLKVLAVEEPLSLQAHPSREQSEEGFRIEEQLRVPPSALHRVYKDPWPKPELLVALTPFTALCGFREPVAVAELFETLDVESLIPYARLLRNQGDEALPKVFRDLIFWPARERAHLVTDIEKACGRLADEGDRAAAWYVDLALRYPDDTGVACALMMKFVELAPGEGVFVPPGLMHAYLHGVGVEIMANSDNVLRGGLTRKHIDVDELIRVVNFDDHDDHLIHPETTPVTAGFEQAYPVPVPEFRMSRVHLLPSDGEVVLDRRGPQLLLTVQGSVQVSANGRTLTVPRGRAAYVSASESDVTITGAGDVFRATSGL